MRLEERTLHEGLLVYPTHENGREVQARYLDRGIDAACYPSRTTESDKPTPQNCWNDSADAAESMGLPVVKTICTTCRDSDRCHARGYLGQLAAVKDAAIAICTHKRVSMVG